MRGRFLSNISPPTILLLIYTFSLLFLHEFFMSYYIPQKYNEILKVPYIICNIHIMQLNIYKFLIIIKMVTDDPLRTKAKQLKNAVQKKRLYNLLCILSYLAICSFSS